MPPIRIESRDLQALVESGQVWLLLTMRSDRYRDLIETPDLLALKNVGTQFDVPLPGAAEIIEVVRGPARMAGLKLEEQGARSLAEELIRSTPNADALPMLQMSLARLFDKRDGQTLTLAAFDAMGKVGRNCHPCR